MSDHAGAVTGGVRTILQLEGAAVAVVAVTLFARAEPNWWLLAGLFLVPDFALLGYLAGPRVGALCYNVVHTYVLPLALWVVAPPGSLATAVALIWLAHIGVDRAVGYGLKYGRAFGETHLGEVGRAQAGPAATTS